MQPFWLRIRAPFAAFRWLQAGVYRATSPTIPPSAAWGFVLNIAGIETRDPTPAPVTKRRRDVPRFEVAIGEVASAEVNTIYQQLHTYPVGNSGEEFKKRAYGSKYWIAPVRREFLWGVDVCIGVRSDNFSLLDGVRRGLGGELPRYGLPFLGDNNFLVDQVDVLESACEARWYRRLDKHAGPVSDTFRLTADIDREDGSRTKAFLYQRAPEPNAEVPEDAWTWVPQ